MLERARTYLPTLILGLLISYFGFHALTGERGLLTAHQRQATLAARQAELDRLEAEKNDLQSRIRLLNSDSLSPDLLEERAHSLLGFVEPDDYVIRLPVKSS